MDVNNFDPRMMDTIAKDLRLEVLVDVDICMVYVESLPLVW